MVGQFSTEIPGQFRVEINSFFFEFVQRRGYDAYGAANASVRLAAQSRFNTDTVY